MQDNRVAEEQETDEIVYQERKRLLFLGLPWTFTKYRVKADMITCDSGFLSTEENDCYMYKVQDVKLTATLIERILGLGTVVCYTGDVTDKELRLTHIRHAREIKDYILKASETARLKRRTVNMQDISADDMDLNM